jgi:hypothetical protein
MSELSGRPLTAAGRDRALFVDREAELASALKILRTGSNLLVLGERGSGKTSFLRQISHELRAEHTSVHVLNGRAASAAPEFLVSLRETLGAVAITAGVKTVGGDAPHGASSSSETRLLQTALANLRDALPDEATYVLVDEMPTARTARTLFGQLRDELWELPLTWLVTADERDRAAYIEPPADAFWRRVLELGPLDEQSSIELLRRRLDDQEEADVLATLAREAGGNPRRLVSLAHDVFVDQQPMNAVLARNRLHAQRRQRVSEPARRLLAELEAGGPASPSDAGLLKSLGWSRSRASQVFGELEENGLVQASDRPGTGGRPRRIYEVVRD